MPTPSPAPQETKLDLPKPLSRRAISIIVLTIMLVTASIVTSLWWAATKGLSGHELVSARFDALRTGLSIGLGTGGLFALYLAWRRQVSTEVTLQQKNIDQLDVTRAYTLQERIAASSEADAAERRINDLYSKSIEQLGSEKAPVRLGALHALERLAQDNEKHRTSVVDVICAYLRMPFDPPPDAKSDPYSGSRHDEEEEISAAQIDPSRATPWKIVPAKVNTDSAEVREARQELQVRLTAQRILANHLRRSIEGYSHKERLPDSHWGDVRLDLSDATLVSLNLSDCILYEASFRRATFFGVTQFNRTFFMKEADFQLTRCHGPMHFTDASFEFDAYFTHAKFFSWAEFGNTRFKGIARFNSVSYHQVVRFTYNEFVSGIDMGGRNSVHNLHVPCVREFPPPWRMADPEGRDYTNLEHPEDVRRSAEREKKGPAIEA